MTQENPALTLGAVGVVGNKIEMVSSSHDQIEQFKSSHTSARIIDCHGKLLMPGLINTHTHVAMTMQRSTGDDAELMEWLNDIVWPFEDRLSDEDIKSGARLGIAEMLLGGTTTFVDMYWSEHAIAQTVEQMGIRAVLAESCLEGERMEQFEKNLPLLIERCKSCDRLSAMVAPHAPYTCPPHILKRAAEIAQKHQLPITIHLAETRDEAKIIRELYDQTPTQYLDECGIIKPSTILAHSIYLSDEDIEIIKSRGAHIAHNPQCNMKISSGVARIPELMEQGVSCTIGTDGAGSNNDLDMWDEMRSAAFLHKLTASSPTVLPAYEVLKMATVNAAKAIGREGELGIIAQGALADIIVMDINKVHYRPHNDIIASLIYCSKSSDVEYVMVAGELLVEQFALTRCDIEEICRDTEQRTEAIFKLIGRA